jgi:hypothetical protein
VTGSLTVLSDALRGITDALFVKVDSAEVAVMCVACASRPLDGIDGLTDILRDGTARVKPTAARRVFGIRRLSL